jgi:hypothetical protein
VVVVADHDPGGGDVYPPYLLGVVVGHDQVGTERSRLLVEGLRVGEANLVARAV